MADRGTIYSFLGISPEDFDEHIRYEKSLSKKVRLFVLERDWWQCRSCTSDYQIQIHHIQPRSAGRDHSPKNLITLCGTCHRNIHDGRLKIGVINGNYFFGGDLKWRSNS